MKGMFPLECKLTYPSYVRLLLFLQWTSSLSQEIEVARACGTIVQVGLSCRKDVCKSQSTVSSLVPFTIPHSSQLLIPSTFSPLYFLPFLLYIPSASFANNYINQNSTYTLANDGQYH
jgi:hypothetical protein